jgi:hypothetical protein
MKIEIKDDLFDEINEYCKVNNIENVQKFIEKLVRKSFTIEKFGEKPSIVVTEPPKIEPKVEKVVEEPILEVKKEVKVTPKIKKIKNPDLYGE